MNLQTADTGERPAGTPGKCFYCHQPASKHAETCVCIEKSVVIRATIEYVVSVPRSWDKESIEFQRNGSGWCADNDLGALADKLCEHSDSCACDAMRFEFVRDATEDDHDALPDLTAKPPAPSVT